jgi:hypothetical protein
VPEAQIPCPLPMIFFVGINNNKTQCEHIMRRCFVSLLATSKEKNEYGFCVQVPILTIGNSITSDVLKNRPKIMYVEHMKLSEFVKIIIKIILEGKSGKWIRIIVCQDHSPILS